MSAPTKIAVAGATGRIGRHVVDLLREQGHDVVPMSRSYGVDVITGEGLAAPSWLVRRSSSGFRPDGVPDVQIRR